MQPGSSNLSINLGKRSGETASGLFYNWVINTGKIIIVGVELLTLLALGYRFVVDKQIVDLNDQIKLAQIFVETQSKKEELYRSLQQRLKLITTTERQTSTKADFIKGLIVNLNSTEFISTSLNVSDSNINIDGQAYSIFALNSMIDALKKNPNVSSISVDELTSIDQGIRFRVSAILKS